MWSFAPEHSKLKPPLITIIVHFYESDNFILGWSASDKVLTRFFFTFWAIRCTAAIFTRKNARETDRKKLVKTPGVITNHCRSSVQWHARAKARLCLPLFDVFFYIYRRLFPSLSLAFLATTFVFEGITIWSMKFISSLHGITMEQNIFWSRKVLSFSYNPKCTFITSFIPKCSVVHYIFAFFRRCEKKKLTSGVILNDLDTKPLTQWSIFKKHNVTFTCFGNNRSRL